jgi:hypothetical protein
MNRKLLSLVALFSFGIINGQNIFRDDFSNYIVNQELSGQGLWSSSPIAPNVGIGACVPLSGTQPCSGSKVVAQPVSFLNYGSSNNSIVLAPVQDGVARAISPVITNGNLYVGMVLNISSAPTNAASPVDFLRVINSDATQVTFRLLVRDTGFGYNVGIRKGASSNPTVYTSDVLNYGENVLVILKYSHIEGPDDDILSVYLNPNYNNGEPSNPSGVTTSGFDQSGAIDRVAFRMNFNVAASMPTGFIGLVSTSTNWQGLSFLPLSVSQFDANNLAVSSLIENNALQINAKSSLDQLQMQVYSTTGTLLEDRIVNISDGNSLLELNSKLSSGLYIIQFIDKNGEKTNFKIISK